MPASCSLGQVDGAEVITVEDLARDETLHPVQQAMVDLHGSQCGFCTPGFVMALFALYHRDDSAGRPRSASTTGSPAISAAAPAIGRSSMRRSRPAPAPANDRFRARRAATRGAALGELDGRRDIFVGDAASASSPRPRAITSLAELYARHPDAMLVAGATDVGLWVTKQLRDLPKVIWLGRVAGLDAIEDRARRR